MASRPLPNPGPTIEIEPYRKVVIHEVIENSFRDLIDSILLSTRSAGGTTIPLLQWCNGVVFQVQPFNPNSEIVIREQLNGVIHLSAISFAVKDNFESEVRTPQGTVRLVNVSINPTWVALSVQLKGRAVLKSG